MVTGAPAKMLDRREELTPMLAQYVDLADEYDDCVLLFRVGDFYKAFCEAADEVARVCELTRIEREDSTGTYTACGVPVDNAPKYLDRLLDAGFRVAVADQVEDAEEASGLVDRAVTQILTPGTVVKEELLAAGSNTYVACVARAPDGGGETGADGAGDAGDDPEYGLAYVDVSTGECAATAGSAADVEEELARVSPAELLRGPDAEFDAPCMTTDYDPDAFAPEAARERLSPYASPDRFPAAAASAAGALLGYAEYTQGDDGPLAYVTRVRRYDPRRSLRLDATALRGLDLFDNRTGSGATLFDSLDETRCALGRRRLRSWLRRPLVDEQRIEARHDAVAAFAERSLVREEVREHLAAAYDLERLVGRVSRERANARDLRSLHDTLAVVPEIRAAIAGVDALADLREDLDPLSELRAFLDGAVAPDPPQEVTEGGVVRSGYHDELDELRSTAREGREWVADLEANERERTGIDNLEVGYNQVHGYYIEVTNGQLEKVPDDYTRRQTLKNSERFYTPELKRREDEILGAEERADALEYEVFADVRADVAAESDRVQELADALARLDALASLAAVAVDRNYVRPEVGADGVYVEGGRHPVVERTEPEFVPNDADLPRGTVALVTGPNMSGKSTYMRQVALHVVLAQAGSFVPAGAARLPVVDRVFTRVGASDDIAGGQSTFMREMSELTDILHDATADSLVLLDEVGRGTATTDGRAIARAAAEFLHDETGATTLFATHYHDLTGLADEYDRVENLHFAATRDDDGVTFLHRVRPGAASSSYGVEVAELAGVPDRVVSRARELVADEGGERPDGPDADPDQRTLTDLGADRNGRARTESDVESSAGPDPSANGAAGAGRPTEVDGPGEPDRTEAVDAVLDSLRGVEVAETTPMEALTRLHDLQRELAAADAESARERGDGSRSRNGDRDGGPRP
ncbi:DNA mismatch repair protein MutS [Candidatus Halobonum tyrrellensis]|uniref:DNA mismatch repair protein MutS n=1 Tax=Candidatus Halobonum tyrrellensis G22 TaxID=1324957 RepID=V4HB50_9EURY|nr:DNA mismatch repair protein MutS [Candidatus Halobonum tyrrellensis]ESP87278.1 DNA mismatch repair protein MutS [Candidatus Halobonum tyrrellensis G22]